MTTRAVEQVDQWDSHPFSGGYRGLHDLSDDGFSGIVAAGPTRLCMTKGNVVGVLDGGIEDFEDASGTVYEAPSPALPLLAVMQERSDEVRAQYYTEDTPLEEVDRTLVDGNFTGYIELAENILSGDYYQVYHQGRSMSVAFVGASEQLLTGDEAFEKANGEVGIYEVRPVDIETVDIPEPEGAAESTASATAEPETKPAETAEPDAEDGSDAEAGPADEPGTEPDADADQVTREPAPDRTGSAEAAGSADDAGAHREDEQSSGPDQTGVDASRRSGRGADAATETSGQRSADTRPDDGESASRREQERVRQSNRRHSDEPRQPPSRERQSGGARDGSDAERLGERKPGSDRRQPADGSRESVGDLEIRSVPSLNPDRTSSPDGGVSPEAAGRADPTSRAEPRSGAVSERPDREQSGQRQPASGAGASNRSSTEQGRERPRDGGASGDRPRTGKEAEPAVDSAEIERLQAELDDRETEIERLEGELEAAESERDELEAELREVRDERDELRERVEGLERRINELRAEEGGESVADRRRLGPGEVIDDTNLFVRYRSKGDATLKAAYEGRAEADTVNENLEIQHHTQFEADEVAVNGEPFAAFLTDTIQYRFVEWMVRVLPYEIRDTGHEGALNDLYDALPRIDRAELNGAVSVVYQEDGEQHRSQETFDVVLRDRMGNPLVVANINQSREPASQGMMETLITAAQRVGESKGSLAGGFLVTSSFFEPEAMEAAADATGGGLLSRDKRESFVKLSRKDGFHLCLVEAREEKFNLSVPEI